MSEVSRIRTFIDGFDDEHLEGGVPKGSIVLICGTTGTMKSSLAFSILYQNAKQRGIPGLYVTLEQDAQSLISQMKSLLLNYDEVKHQIKLLDLSLDPLMLRAALLDQKQQSNFDLLVVDSLDVYENAHSEYSRQLQGELFKFLRSLGCTSFLICGMPSEDSPIDKYGADFLADGIFKLSVEHVDARTVRRRITCLKMRLTRHSTDKFSLIFGDRQFRVPRAIMI